MDELAGDRGGRRDARVREVDAGLGRAHAAAEVAVRRGDRVLAGASTPFEPPKQAPHVGVETIAPASTNTSSRPSSAASRQIACVAGTTIARVRGWTLATAEDRCRLPQVGHGAVGAVADVDLVDRHAGHVRTPVVTLPGRCGSATSGSSADRSISRRCRNVASGIGALRRPGRARRPSRYLSHRLVGREDPRLRPRLDRHVRDRQPLVDRERLRARPDELEHDVRAAAHADLREHGQDHVLPGDEAPVVR